MQLSIINKNGETTGKEELFSGLSDKKYSLRLVHQVSKSYTSNSRVGRAHTKDRAERSGGGKKPWRQKGTGRARSGSNRSPIWRKGGVTFGPRSDRNYADHTSNSMKQAGLRAALVSKAQDEGIFVMQDVPVVSGKTKEISTYLAKLAFKGRTMFLVSGTKEIRAPFARAGRNIPKVTVKNPETVTLLDFLKATNILIDRGSVQVLEKRLVKEAE